MQNRIGIHSARALMLVCLLGIVIACAPVTPNVRSSAPQPGGTTKSGTIRFAAFSKPNASNMSWLMALDLLQKQGYNVETTFYSTSDIAVESLARGDADMGAVGVTAVAAIPKGAAVKVIVAHNANPFSIVAAQTISQCSDLDGRNFAIGARTIISVLVDMYLAQDCNKAAPTFVTITDSQARRAALLGGQVDATTVEIADRLQLDAEAPGKYYSLVDLSTAFPKTNFALGMANNEFAAAHPEIVKDYVTAIVNVNRAILENPQMLRDAMVEHLEYTPDEAALTAGEYLKANVWDPNGGISRESIQTTLDFLSEAGTLPDSLKAEDVADLSFLNAVLDELGRK